MRRGTTPTITLEVDFDLTDWHLYVTIVNGAKSITFENEDLSIDVKDGKTEISLILSQEQTLDYKAGTKCEIQIRAFKDGSAVASDIEAVIVERILKDGVISA